MIGRADDFLVVFYDDHRIFRIAQTLEGGDKSAGVTGVEADAGFVEHIEHAGESGAELGGEADALGFAARE